MHPAAGEQLAHRGVDDRIAGAALAPGVEQRRRRRPTRAGRTRGGARGACCRGGGAGRARRSRATRAGARTQPRPRRRVAGALLELARRDAAEVQVGRQLGGPAREHVVALLVALEARAQPGAHPLPPGRLARRHGVRPPRAPAPPAARPTATPEGNASRRGAPWTSRRGTDSQARWKGVNTECGRPSLVRTRPTSATNSCPAAAAPRPRRRRAPPRPAGRARARTARRRRRSRRRSRQPRRPARGSSSSGRPVAHDEVGAALAQRGAQLGQAAVQEPGAVAGGEAALEQPRVEHEHRHDALALAMRGGQAGWSWTRRSRRNQTRAVLGTPRYGRAPPGRT